MNKNINPAGVEFNTIRPLRGRLLFLCNRGLSLPAIHIQSLRDWTPARRLHHNLPYPRFRGDDNYIENQDLWGVFI